MCDFSKGFKLCTCNEKEIQYREPDKFIHKEGKLVKLPNTKNDQIPIEFIWILYRYNGKNKELEIGRYNFPSEDIGKGLDVEWVKLNLSCENCFDFQYTPQEGDNLILTQNIILSPYLSFIFKNNEWVEDFYNPFEHDIVKQNHGIVKNNK
ncbi:hypothetical protein K6119_01895 [Paracrocinitomix mangrovi]|uniref:hypothetical protein n=1 Tax=Paracrocinitomix mangrovi TaxID=2862509 RepID=UPI001C8EE580|nr:hypothetical protein [Paracrocinitomix mangrovi]UKN02270.1 hypothetical protein K6119_01895 [Paracrocinitomix mangrovi]